MKNTAFKDLTLDTKKMGKHVLTIFWHFIDQMIYLLMKKNVEALLFQHLMTSEITVLGRNTFMFPYKQKKVTTIDYLGDNTSMQAVLFRMNCY